MYLLNEKESDQLQWPPLQLQKLKAVVHRLVQTNPINPSHSPSLNANSGKTKVVQPSFQPSWLKRWPWLDNEEFKDVAYCFTCLKANTKGKLQCSANAEQAFITCESSNLKYVIVKYANHEESKCHKEAVLCQLWHVMWCSRKPFSPTQAWEAWCPTVFFEDFV